MDMQRLKMQADVAAAAHAAGAAAAALITAAVRCASVASEALADL